MSHDLLEVPVHRSATRTILLLLCWLLALSACASVAGLDSATSGGPAARLAAPTAQAVADSAEDDADEADDDDEDEEEDDDDDGELLLCAPLQAAEALATLGPAGGTLMVGPHQLAVPAGALDSTLTLTAAITVDSAVAVTFGPSGLTFREPAALTLDAAHCAAGLPTASRVAYVDAAGAVLEWLPSLRHGNTVTAPVSHFSRFAIAY